MNDLDLLKELPGRVDPPDGATKERIRALVEARASSGPPRRPRRGIRASLLAVAAVLTVGIAAAAVTQHLWTEQNPVGIPLESPGPDSNFGGEISDPNGAITTPGDLAAAVGEFAPSIRLPTGGSFDAWSRQFATHLSDENPAARSEVVVDMVVVSGCQWAQQWLNASAQGDQAGADQAITVFGEVGDWMHAAGIDDTSSTTGLVDRMGKGDRAGIQLFENEQCAYMGAWGATPAEQDAKATGDLGPAIQTAQDYLRSGGDPGAFDPSRAQDLAPNVFWTWSHMQPTTARPGAIFIAESDGAEVTLVSASESGTLFCAVVTDGDITHGTTTADLSVVPDGDGAQAATPGPIACSPGGW